MSPQRGLCKVDQPEPRQPPEYRTLVALDLQALTSVQSQRPVIQSGLVVSLVLTAIDGLVPVRAGQPG